MKQKCLVLILPLVLLLGCTSESCDKNVISILSPIQPSARLLMNYAKIRVCQASENNSTEIAKVNDEQKLILVYDLYLKASIYSIFNKILSVFSIFFAFAVFIWPCLALWLKNRRPDQKWYESPIVQTTMTGIAALLFALYSQYKDKQTYTENLMRYAVFSDQPANKLAQKVIEEIGKIDNGFSFSSVTDDKNKAP
ncbi:hypothetical protein [Methyloglobulus sp.]|uniref:hypothetical protein n=1 Tax=Methyloglobulus sp. TaxID=2518622 RepID=UPI0039890757